MSARRGQVLEHGVGRVHRALQGGQAIKFPEACDRLGFSVRTGRRLIAEGRFPVPELPRINQRSHHRYSSIDIDWYLANGSTADAVVGGSAR